MGARDDAGTRLPPTETVPFGDDVGLKAGLDATASAGKRRPSGPRDGQDPLEKKPGWIDVSICEAILTKDIRLLVAVDGGATSMAAFYFVTDGLLSFDRSAFARVLHIFNGANSENTPVNCRRDALSSTLNAILTSSVSSKRYKTVLADQELREEESGSIICESVCDLPADYILMGCFGIRGPKRRRDLEYDVLGENVLHVLSHGNSCSLICFKDEDRKMLPVGMKKAVYVVSVSLNKSSTKAFLDALRLSKPGDEIHVVYIKSYLERAESDYTAEVREKYECFFSGLKDGEQQVFSLFKDRETKFVLEPKRRRETTPQAVVRYAESVEADFVVVGANAAERVERGKQPVGSVSLQICLLTERNFIVANWIDVIPRVYEESVRRARTPSVSGRPGSASVITSRQATPLHVSKTGL